MPRQYNSEGRNQIRYRGLAFLQYQTYTDLRNTQGYNDIDVALVSENGETTLYFNGLDDSPAPIPYVTVGTGSIHIGASKTGILPSYGHFLSFQLYDFALNADEAKFIS